MKWSRMLFTCWQAVKVFCHKICIIDHIFIETSITTTDHQLVDDDDLLLENCAIARPIRNNNILSCTDEFPNRDSLDECMVCSDGRRQVPPLIQANVPTIYSRFFFVHVFTCAYVSHVPFGWKSVFYASRRWLRVNWLVNVLCAAIAKCKCYFDRVLMRVFVSVSWYLFRLISIGYRMCSINEKMCRMSTGNWRNGAACRTSSLCERCW